MPKKLTSSRSNTSTPVSKNTTIDSRKSTRQQQQHQSNEKEVTIVFDEENDDEDEEPLQTQLPLLTQQEQKDEDDDDKNEEKQVETLSIDETMPLRSPGASVSEKAASTSQVSKRTARKTTSDNVEPFSQHYDFMYSHCVLNDHI
jgi:hypothetical protein